MQQFIPIMEYALEIQGCINPCHLTYKESYQLLHFEEEGQFSQLPMTRMKQAKNAKDLILIHQLPIESWIQSSSRIQHEKALLPVSMTEEEKSLVLETLLYPMYQDMTHPIECMTETTLHLLHLFQQQQDEDILVKMGELSVEMDYSHWRKQLRICFEQRQPSILTVHFPFEPTEDEAVQYLKDMLKRLSTQEILLLYNRDELDLS